MAIGVVLASALVVSSFCVSSPAVASSPSLFGGPQSEVTAPDASSGDNFGFATAISGSTTLIGAYGHDEEAGAAYVFTGPSWNQQAELQATNGAPEDHFGEAVSLDGDTAAIGAPGANGGAGAVYIFGDSGGTWAQEAELNAPDGSSGDGFGQALVLSGTTLIIGAPGRDNATGAAYVFTDDGGTWSQDAELTAPDGAAGDGFATAVAFDGSTVVFGAPQAGSGGPPTCSPVGGRLGSRKPSCPKGPAVWLETVSAMQWR